MMTRIFLADALAKERAALRRLLLVEWSLLPPNPGAALAELRLACPRTIIVVLISHLDPRQLAAQSMGADAFISKGETPIAPPGACAPLLIVLRLSIHPVEVGMRHVARPGPKPRR